MSSISELLSRVTYKPGTNFFVNGDLLTVTIRTANAERPGEEIPVSIGCHIPPGASARQVIDLVRKLIHKIEMHEMDEFLRIDGRPVNEPHPEIHQKERAFNLRTLGEPWYVPDEHGWQEYRG